jgi:hypothetical protein
MGGSGGVARHHPVPHTASCVFVHDSGPPHHTVHGAMHEAIRDGRGWGQPGGASSADLRALDPRLTITVVGRCSHRPACMGMAGRGLGRSALDRALDAVPPHHGEHDRHPPPHHDRWLQVRVEIMGSQKCGES